MSVCHGCGTPIPPSRGGRPRKWCTDTCRKQTTYGGVCEDCGARTAYGVAGMAPARRCDPCQRLASRYWTRDRIVEAFQAFARDHGRAPRVTDFAPAHARAAGQEPRTPEGRWPRQATVYLRFGSWGAAVVAAGLEPFDHARDHSWSPGHPLHERKAA